jgi:hypothetical protein
VDRLFPVDDAGQAARIRRLMAPPQDRHADGTGSTGASWVCYFRALKIGDASKVAPVDKLSLVLAAVFAVLFLHERPSVREWLGILMVGAAGGATRGGKAGIAEKER